MKEVVVVVVRGVKLKVNVEILFVEMALFAALSNHYVVLMALTTTFFIDHYVSLPFLYYNS